VGAEELMAFADGELDAVRRAEVAQWLATHPDSQAEVDEHRRLAKVWQGTPPPEPSADAWAATLVRIESALPMQRRVPVRGWRRPLWALSGLAAAAVFGAVFLWSGSSKDEEEFPVAGENEINIVSMDGKDADALVGHTPLWDMVFATGADVRLVNAKPHGPNGRAAQLRPGDVPMIMTGPAPGK
jgi:hypothetical protein